MQQSEILSLAERLLPVYGSEDFEFVLGQLTEGEAPSAKILVKMELNRLMAPCKKSIDLRGRVQGECREYMLDGIKHYLDDVAFNAYQKHCKKYGSYTEGVWEVLVNPRNSNRTLGQQTQASEADSLTDPNSPFVAEPLSLGYDLKRQEKRLRVQSQVEMTLPEGQIIHGLSIDLSSSGAKFKVPSAFKYKLGDVIEVSFTEFAEKSKVAGIEQSFEYRVLAVDESYDNDSVLFLRTKILTNTNTIERVIDESLNSSAKRARHDNQDKIIRSRTRGYEHITLKHTNTLPLFFDGTQLKLAMLTPNNQDLWQYWHDERNQQALGSLFNEKRANTLIKPGIKGATNILYSFKHDHENKTFFYSMLLPEATREQKHLFWHLGAKRPTWKAFRISVFELSTKEQLDLASYSDELAEASSSLTHVCFLQEISDQKSGQDYLLAEKPRIPTSMLNAFRHTRQVIGNPKGVYFDAQSRRREPRYRFKTPIILHASNVVKSAGFSTDLSKRGLGIKLDSPIALRSGQEVRINFRELQMYDKKLPLSNVPYRVVRVSPDGKSVQLVIDESGQTIKIIAFFNSIIDHNADKLIQQKEHLPSDNLLERLHTILLSRTQGVPVFVSKQSASTLKTPVIGVSHPLPKFVELLARVGHQGQYSLEPIFKSRSGTLIADAIKRIEGTKAQHQDLYIGVTKMGNRIAKIETKLHNDFKNVRERIQFIRRAQMAGEFYAIRVSSAPIFSAMTSLLFKELSDLTQFGVHQASKLEKELMALVGYIELNDITEEVKLRLEL